MAFKSPWVVRCLLCFILAVGAYLWATALMDSVVAYRSPLQQTALIPGPVLGAPATRRVVWVLVDALRVDTATRADLMPVLAQLRAQGAAATMISRPPSYSVPGWSTLLTGGWPELNGGSVFNPPVGPAPVLTQETLFGVAHQASLKTAIAGYHWLSELLPPAVVDAAFSTTGEDATADQAVLAAAQPWLRDPGYALVLIHLDQVDYAGHKEGGPRDPRWDAAAVRVDVLLGEIVALLDWEQDTLLVCSDHGQIDAGGHGGSDPVTLMEPFVLVGTGVRPGDYGNVAMVDVAPTLAALLGASLPPATQGRVLTELLILPLATVARLPEAVAAQQQALLQAYAAGIGQPLDPAQLPTSGDVAAYQAVMDALRQARLTREQWWRALLALPVVIIPALLLARRKREAFWLLAGALLYEALFNGRYTLLDGQIYSYSSVSDADEMVAYIAITAGASLGLAWLLTALLRGLFRRPPAEAAGASLALTLTTAYLLLLPALGDFVLNGPWLTWALPVWSWNFLGLFSLMQLIFVGALGPTLAGLAALIARLRRVSGSSPAAS